MEGDRDESSHLNAKVVVFTLIGCLAVSWITINNRLKYLSHTFFWWQWDLLITLNYLHSEMLHRHILPIDIKSVMFRHCQHLFQIILNTAAVFMVNCVSVAWNEKKFILTYENIWNMNYIRTRVTLYQTKSFLLHS